MAKWYYSVDGCAEGPADSEEILASLKAGKLTLADIVFKDGGEDWVPIGEVEEFKNALPKVQLPPNPAPPKFEPAGPFKFGSDPHLTWVLLTKKKVAGEDKYLQSGPFTSDVIESMLKSGECHYADYVWRPGYRRWARLGNLPEFDRRVKPRDESETAISLIPMPKVELDAKALDRGGDRDSLLDSVVRAKSPAEVAVERSAAIRPEPAPEEAYGSDLTEVTKLDLSISGLNQFPEDKSKSITLKTSDVSASKDIEQHSTPSIKIPDPIVAPIAITSIAPPAAIAVEPKLETKPIEVMTPPPVVPERPPAIPEVPDFDDDEQKTVVYGADGKTAVFALDAKTVVYSADGKTVVAGLTPKVPDSAPPPLGGSKNHSANQSTSPPSMPKSFDSDFDDEVDDEKTVIAPSSATQRHSMRAPEPVEVEESDEQEEDERTVSASESEADGAITMEESESFVGRLSGRKRLWPIAAGACAVLVIVATLAILTSGGDDDDEATDEGADVTEEVKKNQAQHEVAANPPPTEPKEVEAPPPTIESQARVRAQVLAQRELDPPQEEAKPAANPVPAPPPEKTVLGPAEAAGLKAMLSATGKTTVLDIVALKTDLGHPTFAVQTNAPIGETIRFSIAGRSGEIVRLPSFQTTVTVKRSSGEIPTFDLTNLKLPAGSYTVDVAAGGMMKKKKVFIGTPGNGFVAEMEKHLKQISLQQQSEKKALFHSAERMEVLARELGDKYFRLRKDAKKWRSYYTQWQGSVVDARRIIVDSVTYERRNDFAYPEEILALKSASVKLSEQAKLLNDSVLNNLQARDVASGSGNLAIVKEFATLKNQAAAISSRR